MVYSLPIFLASSEDKDHYESKDHSYCEIEE